jgi:hypothetical protein
MVRAILAGKKTQTRRTINLKQLRIRTHHAIESDVPGAPSHRRGAEVAYAGRYRARLNNYGAVTIATCDLGVKPGEFDFECPLAEGETELADLGTRGKRWMIWPKESRLWVKETWRAVERESDMVDGILFRADEAFVPIQNTAEAADRWLAVYDRGEVNGLRPTGPAKWRPAIFLPRWASRLSLRVTSVRIERVRDISEADAVAEGVGDVAEYAGLWREINGAESWDANPWVWAATFEVVT